VKDKTMAALLALFLGGIGIHKFYLGRTLAGVLYLLFCWTLIPALIGLFECIGFLVMSQANFDREYNAEELQRRRGLEERQLARETAPASIAAELEGLHRLLKQGAITQHDFDRQKRRLLGGASDEDRPRPRKEDGLFG
jgi:TM2 domain-containing membrane protein YozV